MSPRDVSIAPGGLEPQANHVVGVRQWAPGPDLGCPGHRQETQGLNVDGVEGDRGHSALFV